MERINLVELLKDCPSGMELDCTMYNKVTLLNVDTDDTIIFPISVVRKDGNIIKLTKYGQYAHVDFAKCIIFPKGKTTWEGFVPPYKFKEGDILTTRINSIFIFSHLELDKNCDRSMCKAYVGIRDTMPISLFRAEESDVFGPYESMCKLATEKEKEKLFQAIKDNGYKWNPETKTLEKLIEPKFKIGDRVKRKEVNYNYIVTILGIYEEYYTYVNQNGEPASISIKKQDDWELVPDKFDITTLKPFDKVLVRNTNNGRWSGQFYMSYDKNEDYPFECTYNCWMQCIPYEGNEHLRGKTDDCNKYFKTWE